MAPATSSRTCCFTSSVETMIDQAKICTATRSLFVKPALVTPLLSSSNWLEHGCLGNSCTDCRCCTPDLPTGQEPLCLQAAAALPSSGTRKDNVTRDESNTLGQQCSIIYISVSGTEQKQHNNDKGYHTRYGIMNIGTNGIAESRSVVKLLPAYVHGSISHKNVKHRPGSITAGDMSSILSSLASSFFDSSVSLNI